MSSKQRQIKNSFIYLVPILIGNLIPFLTLPFFTRILTVEDYGILALVEAYAIFAVGLSNFGMIVGFERNYFQYAQQDQDSGVKIAQLLYSTLLFVSISNLVVGGLTFIIRDSLSQFIIGSYQYGNLLFLAFCSNSLKTFPVYFLTYFKNMQNAKLNSFYIVLIAILNNSVAFYLIVFAKIGVSGILWGHLLSGGIVSFILWLRFLQRLPFTVSWSVLNEALTISYPLTPLVIFKIIGSQFDKYMIGLLGSMGGVGAYNIGQKFANLVFVYMSALQKVFSPQVFAKMFEEKKDGGKTIGVYLTPFLYVSIFAGIMISMFAEELIMLLVPATYYGAIDVVIILSMYFGFMFFGKQPQLTYAKKTYISSILSITSILLNIGLNIPFIIKWGVNGAAWATFIAGLISMLISFIIAQYYYKIHWEYRKVILIYLLFFSSSILIIILRYIDVDYFLRVVTKLIFVSGYIYLGISIGIVSKENFQLLKSLIPFKGNKAARV